MNMLSTFKMLKRGLGLALGLFSLSALLMTPAAVAGSSGKWVSSSTIGSSNANSNQGVITTDTACDTSTKGLLGYSDYGVPMICNGSEWVMRKSETDKSQCQLVPYHSEYQAKTAPFPNFILYGQTYSIAENSWHWYVDYIQKISYYYLCPLTFKDRPSTCTLQHQKHAARSRIADFTHMKSKALYGPAIIYNRSQTSQYNSPRFEYNYRETKTIIADEWPSPGGTIRVRCENTAGCEICE